MFGSGTMCSPLRLPPPVPPASIPSTAPASRRCKKASTSWMDERSSHSNNDSHYFGGRKCCLCHFRPPFRTFNAQTARYSQTFCTFAAVITLLMHIIMSERDKQIEKERKGVVELLLKKNGLTRRQLVDDLVGMWAASWAHILTDEEKKQFPHLVF